VDDDSEDAPLWTATKANAMGDAEIADFLQGPHVASLATHRSDGFVHLTPVWFLFADGVFYITLGERRRHLRNIGRDPRVTLLVHVDERPDQGAAGTVRAVMCCGTAEVRTDPAVVEQYAQRIDARYIGADAASGAAPTTERYQLAVITPVTVLSWDFAKR
jgi:PPOX class probable F420-dependent enzyme